MGNKWDYKIEKMEMAWDLANQGLPKKPESFGM